MEKPWMRICWFHFNSTSREMQMQQKPINLQLIPSWKLGGLPCGQQGSRVSGLNSYLLQLPILIQNMFQFRSNRWAVSLPGFASACIGRGRERLCSWCRKAKPQQAGHGMIMDDQWLMVVSWRTYWLIHWLLFAEVRFVHIENVSKQLEADPFPGHGIDATKWNRWFFFLPPRLSLHGTSEFVAAL